MCPVSISLKSSIQIGKLALISIPTDRPNSLETKSFIKGSRSYCCLQDYKIILARSNNLLHGHAQEQLSTTQSTHQGNLGYRLKNDTRILGRSRSRQSLQLLRQRSIFILDVLALCYPGQIVQGIPSEKVSPGGKIGPAQKALQPSLRGMSHLYSSKWVIYIYSISYVISGKRRNELRLLSSLSSVHLNVLS